MVNIEAEVKRLMATGMTEAEARETALYDAEIESDKSEKKQLEFDLTDEQKKVAKKYTNVGMKTTAYQFTKRERKPNETKRWIMRNICTLFQGFELNDECKAVILSNIERTLDFECDGKQYTLTLTEHRPKKK